MTEKSDAAQNIEIRITADGSLEPCLRVFYDEEWELRELTLAQWVDIEQMSTDWCRPPGDPRDFPKEMINLQPYTGSIPDDNGWLLPARVYKLRMTGWTRVTAPKGPMVRQPLRGKLINRDAFEAQVAAMGIGDLPLFVPPSREDRFQNPGDQQR